jgi:hypothetical protein
MSRAHPSADDVESHAFGFDVLIGRHILCKGMLSLSFDAHYALSLPFVESSSNVAALDG